MPEKSYIFPTDIVIEMINQSSVLISMVLMILVLIVAFQIKIRNQRIRYFLVSIAINLGGMMFQLAGYMSYAYAFYSLVMPAFTLYFLETERDEGEGWDGVFWMSFQTLASVLIIIMVVASGGTFLIGISFLFQYVAVLSMLLISSTSSISSRS